MSHNKGAKFIPRLLIRCTLPALSLLCLILLFLLTFLFLRNNNSDTKTYQNNLALYTSYYKKNAHIPEVAYATLQSLYALKGATKEYAAFEIRVLKHIQKYPRDPNNGYYFLMLGNIAEKRNATGQALVRYTRASQYPPSTAYRYFTDKNSAQESLTHIARIELEPRRSLYYNTLLLQGQQESEKKSQAYYKIGKTYEALGLWDAAYKAYKIFLQHQKNTALEKKENDEQIQDIHFRLARRSANMTGRTWESAEAARRAVSYTLLRGSSLRLSNMRSPSFFMVQWDDDILKTNIYIPKFKIHAVLRRSNIYMEPVFSTHSTYTKKFWRITGWDRVPEWFFVFQKIHQPDIPSINGSWEWAGIYLGSRNAKPYEAL